MEYRWIHYWFSLDTLLVITGYIIGYHWIHSWFSLDTLWNITENIIAGYIIDYR